jgi:hypothetical protein
MNMPPRVQKLALLAHSTFSVGWFGAVVPYLALAIAALTSHDEQMVRAACRSMEFIGWFVIVPFSLAALLSGLVQSLGSRWGLFRHWWILSKLVLTIFAVVVLLGHIRDVSRMSRVAREAIVSSADLRPELIHSAGGLFVLLVVMTLSVFKPWGMTPYERRRASQAYSPSASSVEATLVHEPLFLSGRPRWARIVGVHAAHAVGLVLLLAAILHITGVHHR